VNTIKALGLGTRELLQATTVRPAFSKRAMIWPITFLATASGLMMERVRSIAI
jgi:hypothetical protein